MPQMFGLAYVPLRLLTAELNDIDLHLNDPSRRPQGITGHQHGVHKESLRTSCHEAPTSSQNLTTETHA